MTNVFVIAARGVHAVAHSAGAAERRARALLGGRRGLRQRRRAPAPPPARAARRRDGAEALPVSATSIYTLFPYFDSNTL